MQIPEMAVRGGFCQVHDFVLKGDAGAGTSTGCKDAEGQIVDGKIAHSRSCSARCSMGSRKLQLPKLSRQPARSCSISFKEKV